MFFVACCVALIAAVDSSVQFRLLQDSRLCNNGGLPRYASARCLHPHHTEQELECDTRKLKPEECREVAIELDTFSQQALLQLVPTVDSDQTIRRIVIKMDKGALDVDAISSEIDEFLTERLWWYAHKEPYHWNKQSHRVIVLDRRQHEFEHSLRQMSALNFPKSVAECEKSVLLFNRRDFSHPGWCSVLTGENSVHGEMPYALTAMYVSRSNKLEDSTAFIAGSDCPDKINKWECAFLRTTNCPLPKVVTACTGDNCVANSVPDTRRSTVIFDAASEGAKNITVESPEWHDVHERAAHPPEFNTKYMHELAAKSDHGNPTVKYLRPYNWKAAPFQIMMKFDLELYVYSYILRPSAYYRSRIAEAIKQFRIEHNFTTTDRCVAAQVRRGDRVLMGANITEFCMRPENKNSDKGCSVVPFQSVTLEHVVDSAEKLVEPTVRTVIVTTDDEEWLNEQREALRTTRPSWTVLNLKAPHSKGKEGGDDYKYMRYGAGTASGILLHGSIELSRQCEAFVGHFGCGSTVLVYRSLCAQHNHREYVCPPSFDVRTIPELIIHH
jgi:hypothetical protein